MNKKGQAAMEFLMTYGWAILVVIAAIAVLAASGILDFNKIFPEKCAFPTGLECVTKAPSLTANTVTVSLRNNAANGNEISITGFNTSICTGASWAAAPNATATTLPAFNDGDTLVVNGGSVFRLQVTCASALAANSVETGTFTVTYSDVESGLSFTAVGDIKSTVPA